MEPTLNDELREILRRTIDALPYSRAALAQKHGLQKQYVTNLLNGSSYVSPGLVRRIVTAVRQEAAETGVEFPGEKFEHYLCHTTSV